MRLGILGGTGLYDLEVLQNVRQDELDTPFGQPSGPYTSGTLAGLEIVFLPRHGQGHRLLPSEINHRANICGMKMLGVDALLSISAVGSFREEMRPGDLILVDQFVDRTKRSADHTFFGDGIVAHVAFAHPTCTAMRQRLYDALLGLLGRSNPHGVRLHLGGTYLNMEGPAFSTVAESRLYQSWGMDVIGMTNLAEAKLAREAEICYQSLAMVTDYDSWHEVHGPIDIQQILAVLRRNVELSKRAVLAIAAQLVANPVPADCACRSALQHAIITDPRSIPAATRGKLAPIVAKYLP